MVTGQPLAFRGITVHGAPIRGSFLVGDTCYSSDGVVWLCVVAGTPGTWVCLNPFDDSNEDN